MSMFSRCNGCPLVNHVGGGGTCECVNPLSDWATLLSGPDIIMRSPEERKRLKTLRERRHSAFYQNLDKLFPDEIEQEKFLETRRPELGGISISEMREWSPYGIDVSDNILSYLAGNRENCTGWDKYFKNAMNGYFFLEEREPWLDSVNNLFGGRSNREIVADGGYQVLTEILWFLLNENPEDKKAPMFREPRVLSPAEEEMEIEELFPELDSDFVDSFRGRGTSGGTIFGICSIILVICFFLLSISR